MIRLNSWQESVSRKGDEQQHRLSELISSNVDARKYDPVASKRRHINTSEDGGLSNDLLKLQRRELVSEIQFWNDFSKYMGGLGIPQRCILVKTLSNAVWLTEDLLQISVVDEEEKPRTLYLSLRWMLNQGNLTDRTIVGIMNGRPLDEGIVTDDVLCLYDEVTSNDAIFADKFHLDFA